MVLVAGRAVRHHFCFPAPLPGTVTKTRQPGEAPPMKIAIVAQHATPLTPRADGNPRPDDTALSDLTRALARQAHRVPVYAQKHQPGVPDHAEVSDGVHVEHIPAGPVGKPGDVELLARVPAFSK